ncbi:ABC transporter ATP-binding protein [Candidatus Solirubrobacter pratensis]|uniref:ABC transporter ATP-binding protein n=1 Tax=Candidatus Solirubrobacter pratensis TaxID=1298857 RepID=UPI000407B890|nr:ATP-binding cassette domain-containing protein [Candidatus Solirubrobacter pratensis]
MAAQTSPALTAHGLSKHFASLVVFEDVSLQLRAGEVLGVVGPNGAGKSTLLSVLTGTVRRDSGRVLLGSEDVSGHSAPDRCRHGLARTYQVPRPFHGMSVFENALVAARFGGRRRGSAGEQLAWQAVVRAGLEQQSERRAGELGLLDRKRLELAKALATDPSVLLLDEIAGGLTDPEVEQVVGIVRGLRDDGVAVLWIEHIVHALTSVVDRLLCLAGGRVLREGSPEAVLQDAAVRRVYLGSTADALESAA